MSSRTGSGSFRIVEQQRGEVLRLEALSTHPKDAAAELLALFEAELDAELEGTDRSRGDGLRVGSPVLIRLESLEIEFCTDGSQIALTRVTGSRQEFEELCEFLREQGEFS